MSERVQQTAKALPAIRARCVPILHNAPSLPSTVRIDCRFAVGSLDPARFAPYSPPQNNDRYQNRLRPASPESLAPALPKASPPARTGLPPPEDPLSPPAPVQSYTGSRPPAAPAQPPSPHAGGRPPAFPP